MSLAPKWAKAAAVLGLRISILHAQAIVSELHDKPFQQILVKITEEYEDEINRIAAMKD